MNLGPASAAYAVSVAADRLHQGEILSNVIEWRVFFNEKGEAEADRTVHPFAVVLTPDCDLEQDFNARADLTLDKAKRDSQQLDHVLLVVADDLATGRGKVNSAIWSKARTNQDVRYEYLGTAGPSQDLAGLGFDGLLLDFKRVFSVPIEQMTGDIAADETKKRACLLSPYVEHLAVRGGYFHQRVALPVDHHDLKPPAVARLEAGAVPT